MFNFKTADGKQQVDVCRLPLTRCLTLGRTNKVIPHRGTRGGGRVDGVPPLGFCCVSIFGREFAVGRKLFMCSTR